MIQFSFTALINHLQTFIFCLTFTLSQINNKKNSFFVLLHIGGTGKQRHTKENKLSLLWRG